MNPHRAALTILAVALFTPAPLLANDFPTAARAEYVFGCMAANGQTPEMLNKCSCSIDTIAERIPFEQYERIETVLTMQQLPGQRAAVFREAPWVKELLDRFQRAQAEANLHCF